MAYYTYKKNEMFPRPGFTEEDKVDARKRAIVSSFKVIQ